MITEMPAPRIGSVWSVLGLRDATVAVLAGPFRTARGNPEYLVAPLYAGSEPGFAWTSEDVRLDASETGLGEVRFAAIWNARPVLESDLALELGEVRAEATIALRDAYWASLNERPLGPDPRLGKALRAADDPAAEFQARELERWERLSGRVFETPLEVSATAVFPWRGTATFGGLELGAAIQESETLVGPVGISGSGPAMVWLTGSIVIGSPTAFTPGSPDLFTHAPDPAPYVERRIAMRVNTEEHAEAPHDAANSELALAA